MLQPPVKFYDVVPNGKLETKTDVSKNLGTFLVRETLSLYGAHAYEVACYNYKWYLRYDSEKAYRPREMNP